MNPPDHHLYSDLTKKRIIGGGILVVLVYEFSKIYWRKLGYYILELANFFVGCPVIRYGINS